MERRRSLLLVEDEHGLRHLVSEFLRFQGFRVVEAEDGPSAVERFGDSRPFDLALVDLNLPGFSGVEVCRRLRALEPRQPILICSGAILPDHEGPLKELRVNEFLSKPFHPSVLLSTIVDCIRVEEHWQSAGPHLSKPLVKGHRAPSRISVRESI